MSGAGVCSAGSGPVRGVARGLRQRGERGFGPSAGSEREPGPAGALGQGGKRGKGKWAGLLGWVEIGAGFSGFLLFYFFFFSNFNSISYFYFKQSLNSNFYLNSNHTQTIKTMHQHECNTKI